MAMTDHLVRGIIEGRGVDSGDGDIVRLQDIAGRPSRSSVAFCGMREVADACIAARTLESTLARIPLGEIMARIEAAGELYGRDGSWLALVADVTGAPIAHVRAAVDNAGRWMRGIREYAAAAFAGLTDADGLTDVPWRPQSSRQVLGVPGGATAVLLAGDDAGLPAFAIVQALLARCPVVAKPSLREPISSYELVRTLLEVGLGEFVQLLIWDATCSPDLGPALLRGTSQAVVFGSDQTVRALLAKGTPDAAPRAGRPPARLIAHTTGRSAAIVLADADPEYAAAALVGGAIWNRGTECVSTKTAYVESGVWDRLLAAIRHSESGLCLGLPTNPAADVSPIPTDDRATISRYLEVADVLCGRTVGDVMSLHVVRDDRNDSIFVREELPGPVLALVRVGSVDEAVRQANSVLAPGRSRTCLSVFSSGRPAIAAVARGARAHTIRVNQPTAPPDWFAMHDGRYLARELLRIRGVAVAMADGSGWGSD